MFLLELSQCGLVLNDLPSRSMQAVFSTDHRSPSITDSRLCSDSYFCDQAGELQGSYTVTDRLQLTCDFIEYLAFFVFDFADDAAFHFVERTAGSGRFV